MGLERRSHSDEYLTNGASILGFGTRDTRGTDTEISAQANPNSFGHLSRYVWVHGTFSA
jgi:hypothetical protein